MSVKTKAQKIVADERREKVSYSLPAFNSQAVPELKKVVSSDNYEYVVFDLKKIGLFSILAFASEIVLKVILQKG